MSNYKDFTNYNIAAENIRPTARIQLIQRILNAANIISNAAAGVPLRWANAYKSFQVLVPQESGAPSDYTTAEAISAVDSVLHEAESLLKSSQDDMNTLTTELSKMPLTGTIDHVQYAFDVSNKYLVVYDTGTSQNVVALNIDSNIQPDFVRCFTRESFEALHPGLKVNGTGYIPSDNRSIYSYINTLGANREVTYTLIPAKFPDSQVLYGFIEVVISHSRIGTTYDVTCTKYDTNHNFLYARTYNFDVNTLQPDTNVSGDRIYNCALKGTIFNAEVKGSLDSTDALGLPDPTDVITELDNLE